MRTSGVDGIECHNLVGQGNTTNCPFLSCLVTVLGILRIDSTGNNTYFTGSHVLMQAPHAPS